MLHDALTAIAYAIKASVGETCVVHRQVPKKYCPVRKAEVDSRCKPLAEHLSEVMVVFLFRCSKDNLFDYIYPTTIIF